MIVVLYQRGCMAIGRSIASRLNTAFAGTISVRLLAADSAKQLLEEPSWNDLLVVLYKDANRFAAAGEDFVRSYINGRGRNAALLPVSISSHSQKPPPAAAAIKSFELDPASSESHERLTNRIGGMLGLRWQGRDSRIFISYRICDGEAIAEQLYQHLASLGHPVFLDKAKEPDGETMILPGREVEEEIGRALETADMILLVDTPSAPASPWIDHEINVAGSLLLPILPICFRAPEDHRRGPRFPALLALQRWVDFRLPGAGPVPLSGEQLQDIVLEAERYLCQVFQRKCRVPFLVEKEFVSRGYAWKVLNERLSMYQSSKGVPRIATKVISHCSIFDPNYGPALKRFMSYLKETIRCNFSLFIYDGGLLPASQLDAIAASHDEPVVILHHQELATLIDSNFTALSAP